MSFPNVSPLPPEQQQLVQQLASGIAPDQATWLSGFFAGIGFAHNGGALATPDTAGTPATTGAPAAAAEKRDLTVLYGTESGNAEALAAEIKKRAERHEFKPKLVDMAEAKPADLAKVERLLVVVSTWGEGDPPDAATAYYETFMGEAMPQLPNLAFSVCALGDTSYEHFCKIGRDFDSRLSQLGGERVHDRAECDVDYQATFDAWIAGALEAFAGPGASASPAPAAIPAEAEVAPTTAPVLHDKKNPFPAEVVEKVVLSGTGSLKETLHLELSLEGSGIEYEPGDSIGIYPENSAADVESVIGATGLRANARLGEKTLADALRTDFDITTLSPAIAGKYNEIVGNDDLQKLLEEDGKKELKEWIHGRQLVDLLETFPHGNWSPETFTGILRKLNPRLYSIASSRRRHEDQVHLTIAAVRYHTHGRDRTGVCSCHVADDVEIGDRLPVFLHSNKNFRLPENDETPLIMVGPGTGIAPFRAFVEERAARNATGRNWLFFGEQHFSYDFLYQLEWQEHLDEGHLHALDLAFSRDQKEKLYVQHRLAERGAEIWQWLQEGAHFYVCGDAARMAKDVHQALLDLVATHGDKSPEDAKAWVEDLRKSKRYQRDVY